ncbi:MAG TPA: carboxypeptidase-like regulatory domain-containing protein [Candidatus Sulfotelmatobacter sp.]|nr:carboxypeptidase-like regulatory domain-containing protein [Candidatus Sulfotelmatobacter sp.]
MSRALPKRGCWFYLLALLFPVCIVAATVSFSWTGVLTDSDGKRVSGALVKLQAVSEEREFTASTSSQGEFSFRALDAGSYRLSVQIGAKVWEAASPVVVSGDKPIERSLQITSSGEVVQIPWAASQEVSAPSAIGQPSTQASGGEHLSGAEVSSLPLNARDFSKLLLLAAGTMTDANGAANFTQQFAVNGQRGVTTVFAMDGFDTTDPEMGGATFSNFNVDAIQEVQSSAGVMPADIGHGAASYTNVVTKSGVDQIHGTLFEFLRNASFDARNYFDYKDPSGRRRIPPFARNEFGFTNGGPVVIPGGYNGRGKTFYFGEYQGFRQVLGTTQVIPVPTANERKGIDITTYPGDTLTVPVNPQVEGVLNGYPLPNEPNGAFGDRTYAASSKVVTVTDQFSIRIDHKISEKASLMTRFSLNQVTGPLTNPDQTAINPTFGIQFFDHQRNAGVHYTRTLSPHVMSDTFLSYIRSTPFFPADNHVQPGITYADGLYQPYNQPAGSIFGSYSNLFQIKQDFSWIRGKHAFKWGTEIRVNRDSTIFGVNTTGLYEFGGGQVLSPVKITSASGTHDIQVGEPLPDSLTGLLTASPYSYNIMAAASITPVGNKFNEAGVRREAYGFYFEDVWKATQKLSVSYGLRYEVNSRIHEATKRTSLPVFFGADGKPTGYGDRNATQEILINPQPPYNQDWNGWGPRLAVDYSLNSHTVLHAGGAITTLIPNLWQDNALTAGIPFEFSPAIYARPSEPINFQNTFVPLNLPTAYNIQGQPIFATGRSQDVPANTVFDYARFQADLNALAPGNVQLLTVPGIAKNFGNGYMGSWTAGVDHDFHDFKASVAYVGTAGVHLARYYNPNGYGGACQGFAPFTQFDSQCHATGGFGPETIMSSGSHSTYHALQTSLTKNSARLGLGVQASYTYSKALDDTSSVLAGLLGTSGTVLQTAPQNPWDPSAEKGPSTFDVTHVFAASVIQVLPLDRIAFLRPVSKTLTKGWQFLNITTLTTGSPFSVFSGVQQTGAGLGGGDRPDLVSMPHLSTSRTARNDYFGMGAVGNRSFFDIPINVPGGTGPNQGRFGTLGRDTFRGPGYHDYDIALIKDTPFGHRGNAELGTLEFRAEFFNIFNVVNFGLPSNIVSGSGFGIISKTSGTSRQIQFSLKILY